MLGQRSTAVEALPAPGPGRRRRADAERNKAALLKAAQLAYAEEGIDVSMEEIARRAGVGIGTLYRHFPRAKQQLVSEALIDSASGYVEAADRALEAADPWEGFVAFVEEICAMGEKDLALSDVLAMVLPPTVRLEELRGEANQRVVEIVQRAKAAGKLRADFVGDDLLLLLIAHAAVVRVTKLDAPGAAQRVVALFLRAVGAPDTRTPVVGPPASRDVRQAMVRLARNRGCAQEPKAKKAARSTG